MRPTTTWTSRSFAPRRVIRRGALVCLLAAGGVLSVMGSTVGVGALGAMVLAAFAGPAAAPAQAAPEPDPVPRRWQLEVEVGPLRIASVDVPGEGSRMFYFLTYRAINRTGEDVLFTPSFEMANDTGEVKRAGQGVSAAATRAVIAMLGNPLLQDPIEVVGTFLQGERNAKESVAIWPVNVGHVREMEVYAQGFSGEIVNLDAFDPATGKTKRVTLRKTLMLRYNPAGEVRPTGSDGLEVLDRRWIMR